VVGTTTVAGTYTHDEVGTLTIAVDGTAKTTLDETQLGTHEL
jgi:hypothetical protein